MTTGGLHALQSWLAHEVDERDLELVCAEHPDPSPGEPDRTVVRLSACVRDVAAHELVELLLVGARSVAVRLDGCSDPAAGAARVDPVVRMLRAGGVDRVTVETDDPADARRTVLDADRLPVPRRLLLGLAGGVARTLPVPDDDPHTRLVSAVRALVPTATRELTELDAPSLRLTGHGCTACGVCVLACPPGALRIQHGSGGGGIAISTLLQTPAACTGCRSCIDLCPTGVLGAVGPWPWSELLVDREVGVATLTTARCERCGTSFPTTSGNRCCPTCTYRRSNPFGSALPPGFTMPGTDIRDVRMLERGHLGELSAEPSSLDVDGRQRPVEPAG
ncbi:MAG: 4Fe-4S dicluster domain-containing protein [Cellulomonas sp.]|nr:4Fe-4S dicluster domain-containing protein [Cellulomonas sp.]